MPGPGSINVEVRSERWGADGWRGGIVVPTPAGAISLLVAVPPGAVRHVRETLAMRGGPRTGRELAGAARVDPELAGFLPALAMVGTVVKLVRKYGPKVKALVKRFGLKRVFNTFRRKGLRGIVELVQSLARAGGIAGRELAGLAAWKNLPPEDAARIMGSAAVLAGALRLPDCDRGTILAGLRALDSAALARLGNPRAVAELRALRAGRGPARLRRGAELASKLLGS